MSGKQLHVDDSELFGFITQRPEAVYSSEAVHLLKRIKTFNEVP
jgi:hypothetical protein